jgi:MFS family permease
MSAIAAVRERHAREAALAAVCAVLLLTFLDNTIVSVALANIQSSLSVSVPGLQWIVNGYMLAFAALMLTGGTLGDLFGRKKVMLGGVAIFCGGAVMAAVAPGSGILIAGRIVMGIGAAASEPGTLSVLRHIYPEREKRARALGVWAAVSGLALALGPVLGGVLVEGAGGWRSIFWFSLGLGALCFAAAAVTLTESSDPEGRQLDVPGLATGASAILAATFAVIEGENQGYTTWWIVALFVLAAVLVVAFVEIERRAPDPVLKLEFLRDPTFTSANVVAFAINLSVFSVFFFTALYLQLISNFSGYQIALVFTSLAVAMIVAGPIAGRWTARVGPRWPMVLGCVLAGAGLLLTDHQHRDDERRRPHVAARDRRARLRHRARLGDAGGADARSARGVGHGRLDGEHESRARRRLRRRRPRCGGQRPAHDRPDGQAREARDPHPVPADRDPVRDDRRQHQERGEQPPGKGTPEDRRHGARGRRGLRGPRRPPRARDRRRDRPRGRGRRAVRCAA